MGILSLQLLVFIVSVFIACMYWLFFEFISVSKGFISYKAVHFLWNNFKLIRNINLNNKVIEFIQKKSFEILSVIVIVNIGFYLINHQIKLDKNALQEGIIASVESIKCFSEGKAILEDTPSGPIDLPIKNERGYIFSGYSYTSKKTNKKMFTSLDCVVSSKGKKHLHKPGNVKNIKCYNNGKIILDDRTSGNIDLPITEKSNFYRYTSDQTNDIIVTNASCVIENIDDIQ